MDGDRATVMTTSDVRMVTRCRYCGSSDLVEILSLGDQPPSNSFLRLEDLTHERRYPLDLVLCRVCFLAQLRHVVSPKLIFDDYLYLSSTSGALKRQHHALAASLTKRFSLRGGLAVDIGCNDGVLLSGFPPEVRTVGVEPSRVAEIARQAGLKVIRGFFDDRVASEILSEHGTARVVTATNVFPHVDGIADFVDALLPLLGDSGVFVVEASYLPDVIDGGLFDTIYHEHLAYLSLTAVEPLLLRHGLEVFDVERVPTGASGPAFRFYAQREGGPESRTAAVAGMLSWEREWGVHSVETYLAFARRVRIVRERLLELLSELRATGAVIGGYGAPAKGNTLMNYVGLDVSVIREIAETNPLKCGLLTPGSHIPIVSETDFLIDRPDYALLLSWNYLDYFLEKSEYVRQGGRFIVPVPEPRIVP